MWLNRVFADLANTDERHCLTSDCSGVNKKNPGRYRTQADDLEKHVCYFHKPHDDELYNVFICNRKKTENFSNSIYFKVDQGKKKYLMQRKRMKMVKMVHTINFQNLTQIHNQSLMEEVENENMKKLLSNLTERLGSQLDSDFFQDDNDVQKVKTTTKHSSIKVKTRNLLMNVSCRR